MCFWNLYLHQGQEKFLAEVGPSHGLRGGSTPAGSTFMVDFGSALLSLAVASITILVLLRANGRKPNFLPQEIVCLGNNIFKD